MAQTIQVRRGLAAQWTAANTLLAQGELGTELDTGKWKLGDGSTHWNSLGYAVGGTGPTGPAGPPGPAAPTIASSQQSGTSYTFALADAATVVEATNAAATTFTVPPNSSIAFPVGTIIEVFQYGAGQVTITPGAGVTLRSDGARTKTAAQYATIGLRQRATDEWVCSGDLI